MTLDEHIKKAEEDAAQAESDSDWGMGNYFIDRTEALEYAENCRQLAEWLKDYKRLLDLEICGDAISREETEQAMIKLCDQQLGEWAQNPHIDAILDALENVPSVMIAKTRPKMGRSIRWSEQKEDVSDTNVGDMVSRQAAIDAIETWGLIDGLSEGQAIEILSDEEKLPPVTPQPKMGQWIKLPYMAIEADGTLHFSYECSSCKGISYFRRSERKIVGGLYCPNCGAKMQRVEDNG